MFIIPPFRTDDDTSSQLVCGAVSSDVRKGQAYIYGAEDASLSIAWRTATLRAALQASGDATSAKTYRKECCSGSSHVILVVGLTGSYSS